MDIGFLLFRDAPLHPTKNKVGMYVPDHLLIGKKGENILKIMP